MNWCVNSNNNDKENMYKYLTTKAIKYVLTDTQHIKYYNDVPHICTDKYVASSIEYEFKWKAQLVAKILAIYIGPVKFNGEIYKNNITQYYYKYGNSDDDSLTFTIMEEYYKESSLSLTVSKLDDIELYIKDENGLHRLLLLLLIDPLKCINMIRTIHGKNIKVFDVLEANIYSHDVKYLLLREIVREGFLVNDLVPNIMDRYLKLL